VLVAKLTREHWHRATKWFGAVTRNPWNTKQGIHGRGGAASATAAGCVAFAIGFGNAGSISSRQLDAEQRPASDLGFVARTGAWPFLDHG